MTALGDAALPFAGWTVAPPRDAELPSAICAEHLCLLGAREMQHAGNGRLELHPPSDSSSDDASAEVLSCVVSWTPFEQRTAVDEAIIQASSGLMAVHGGERGIPRRLGLDVASVAAGTIAAQGLLAGRLARARGKAVRDVRSSVLQGALSYLHHHLAIGTCGGSFPFQPMTEGRGPPFHTADGAWVELEALSGDAWLNFWTALDVDPELASQAWLPFVYRYLAGRCTLPAALHDATRRRMFADVKSAATANGLAACRVRAHDEVFADRPHYPWTFASADQPHLGVPPTQGPTRGGPLSGLRVIEVTSRLQGPFAGQLLRQLGAEVVKVEPRGGDFGRCSPPFAGSSGAAYLAYNHGKRVEELDYKHPGDRARLRELVSDADVFLHNWPHGRAERLGLDVSALTRCNARLVYAHASGWGSTIAEPSVIAGDQLVQAHAGFADLLSPADEPALPSRVTIVDTMGGLLACEGIVAALCVRERIGHGLSVDTSLFGGAMTLRADARKRPSWEPLDRPIRASDRYLVVRAKGRVERETLAALCGVRPRLPAQVRDRNIVQRLATRPAAEWIAPLANVGIAATVVHTEFAHIPDHWKQTRIVERVDDACWVPAAPWSFSA